MGVIYCIVIVFAIIIFCGIKIGLYDLRVSNSTIETKDLLKKQVKLQEEQLKMQKENK